MTAEVRASEARSLGSWAMLYVNLSSRSEPVPSSVSSFWSRSLIWNSQSPIVVTHRPRQFASASATEGARSTMYSAGNDAELARLRISSLTKPNDSASSHHQ